MRRNVQVIDQRIDRLRALLKRLRVERRLAVLCQQQQRAKIGGGSNVR